jgi:hypothetical protein
MRASTDRKRKWPASYESRPKRIKWRQHDHDGPRRYPPRAPSSGFVEPCLLSRVARPPTGLLWLHEIKHNFGAFSGQTSYFRHGDTASVTLMETPSKE